MRKLLVVRRVAVLCLAATIGLVSALIEGRVLQGESKATTTQNATAGHGGTAINAGRDVTFINGITLEQYEAGLKRREKEVRDELGKASAQDKQTIALLKRQLAALRAQLQDPLKALAEYKAKLARAYQEIDRLSGIASPDEIARARAALAKGDTSAAEVLFRQAYDKGLDVPRFGGRFSVLVSDLRLCYASLILHRRAVWRRSRQKVCRACSTAWRCKSSTNQMEVKGSEAQGLQPRGGSGGSVEQKHEPMNKKRI